MAVKYLNLCLTFLFVFLAGCGQSPEEKAANEAIIKRFNQNVAERDSVIQWVTATNNNQFSEAFHRIQEYNYTRYSRTDQFDDDDDALVAFRERTVKHAGPTDRRNHTILSADSSGAYDFGFFRHFVSATVEEQDPEDLTPYLFPEDPEYLSERNYEAYLYHFISDTLMLDTRARVAEIRAIPKAGDGKNIRRARFYFDGATRQFLAFELERIDLAMFFREESRFFVHLQHAPDGQLVPYNTRFETRITMPFKPPQIFRTVATYSDVSG